MRDFAELLGWLLMGCSGVFVISALIALALNLMWKKTLDAYAFAELKTAVREYKSQKGGVK